MAMGIMGCLADRLRQAADQLESQQSQDVLGRVSAAILTVMEAHGRQEDLDSVAKDPTLLRRRSYDINP